MTGSQQGTWRNPKNRIGRFTSRKSEPVINRMIACKDNGYDAARSQMRDVRVDNVFCIVSATPVPDERDVSQAKQEVQCVGVEISDGGSRNAVGGCGFDD